MKISYGITVYNELEELNRLLHLLDEYIREEDEVVVVYDSLNGSKEVKEYLDSIEGLKVFPLEFDGHFSHLKNYLKKQCTGDYIFQLDADELVHPSLLQHLPELLEKYAPFILTVPRVNLELDKDITEIENFWEFILSSDPQKRIYWPDYQTRIMRNIPEIRWIRNVHEVLSGALYTYLPATIDCSILHLKDMRKEKDFFIYPLSVEINEFDDGLYS